MEKTLQLLEFISKKCYSMQQPPVQKLLKIAYLCDWCSSVTNGGVISEITWTIQITGIEASSEEFDFESLTLNVSVFGHKHTDYLRPADLITIEKVIKDFKLKNADMGTLKSAVNATYPAFLSQEVGTQLNLPSIAAMYRHMKTARYWDDKTITDQETNSLDSMHR